MSEEEKMKRSLTQKGVAKKEGHSDNVRNAVLGNISINKDSAEKKVKRDTLEQWLADGWELGGKKRKQ
jgi:homoserine kinase